MADSYWTFNTASGGFPADLYSRTPFSPSAVFTAHTIEGFYLSDMHIEVVWADAGQEYTIVNYDKPIDVIIPNPLSDPDYRGPYNYGLSAFPEFSQPEQIFNNPRVPREGITEYSLHDITILLQYDVWFYGPGPYGGPAYWYIWKNDQKELHFLDFGTTRVHVPYVSYVSHNLPVQASPSEAMDMDFAFKMPAPPFSPTEEYSYYLALEDVSQVPPARTILFEDWGNPDMPTGNIYWHNNLTPAQILPNLRPEDSVYNLRFIVGYKFKGILPGTEVTYSQPRPYERCRCMEGSDPCCETEIGLTAWGDYRYYLYQWDLRVSPPLVQISSISSPPSPICADEEFSIQVNLVNTGYYAERVYLNCICNGKSTRLQTWDQVAGNTPLSHSGTYTMNQLADNPTGSTQLVYEVGYIIPEPWEKHATDTEPSNPFFVETVPDIKITDWTNPPVEVLADQQFSVVINVQNVKCTASQVYLESYCGGKTVRLATWNNVGPYDTRHFSGSYTMNQLATNPSGLVTIKYTVGYIVGTTKHPTNSQTTTATDVISAPQAYYDWQVSNPPQAILNINDFFSIDLYCKNLGVAGTCYIDLDSPGYGRREMARFPLATGQSGLWQSGQIQINDIAITTGGQVELEFFFGHISGGTKVDDETQPFTVSVLTPVTKLTVQTSPVSGQVYIDGVLKGSGYVTVEVDPGTHVISFGDVDGYETPADITVTILAGQQITKYGNYTLIENPTTIITVQTSPVDGGIYLDGTKIGTGLVSVEVDPGTYVISFGNVSGYTTPGSITVDILEGQHVTKYGTYIEVEPPPDGEESNWWKYAAAGVGIALVGTLATRRR